MLENGATTLWEHWEFSDNTYSHNHPMFGSVSEWFYKVPGGINAAPDAVGFDKIILRPRPLGDLTWAKASYNSVRGIILSEWRREGRKFKFRAKIPVGATAAVILPATAAAQVTEGGRPIALNRAINGVTMESGNAILAVGSGDFDFEVVER